jgi:acetyltransferase-like isoleucine patch superfamily enzyme
MNLVETFYSNILEAGLNYGKTCSILNLEDNSLTFARNNSYLLNAMTTNKNIGVIVPPYLDIYMLQNLPDNVKLFPIHERDNIEYIFTYIHNEINKDKEPKANIIGKHCNIHETAIIGVHGNTYCRCPDGGMINLKHMGNVVIEDNVDIEALSIVHRGGMSSTTIGEGSKICVKCNIGHNCIIGKYTFIAPGVLLGGSTSVGDNCYIWQGVITRSVISICDNVIIGAGSLVLNDITKSGIYYGNPVKYVKPYDDSLR